MAGREYTYHGHRIDIDLNDSGYYVTTIDGSIWLLYGDDEIEAERQAEKYIREYMHE